MNQPAIEKLLQKLNELKHEYKTAKQKRIDLVETMTSLDDKLSSLEEKIKAKKSMNIQDKNTLKDKVKNILEILRRTSVMLPFALFINMIINILVAPTPKITLIQFITNFITLFTFNSIQLNIKNNKHQKKINSLKKLSTLEKQYNELKQQRISLGQKYKKVREQEVLTEKIFKKGEAIIQEQIYKLSETNDMLNYKPPVITTRDIYSKINLDLNYVEDSIEHKKETFDIALRKYLAKKVSNSYYDAFQPEEIIDLTPLELIEMLLKQVDISKHKDILENIIHAILIFSSNLQEYHIVWSEEKNPELITEPRIIYDEEDRWIELKTHQNTDYKNLFTQVYNICINELLTKQDKKRTKQKSN